MSVSVCVWMTLPLLTSSSSFFTFLLFVCCCCCWLLRQKCVFGHRFFAPIQTTSHNVWHVPVYVSRTPFRSLDWATTFKQNRMISHEFDCVVCSSSVAVHYSSVWQCTLVHGVSVPQTNIRHTHAIDWLGVYENSKTENSRNHRLRSVFT